MGTRGWFQRYGSSSFEFLLAEGDSVERSDRNVLQGTFCFQLSTVFQLHRVGQRCFGILALYSTVTFRLSQILSLFRLSPTLTFI